jgi:acetyl esterase/lipase
MLLLGVRQVCIAGAKDNLVPARHVSTYADAAKLAGDEVQYIEIKDAGHFDLVAPTSAAWAEVEESIVGLVEKSSGNPKKAGD